MNNKYGNITAIKKIIGEILKFFLFWIPLITVILLSVLLQLDYIPDKEWTFLRNLIGGCSLYYFFIVLCNILFNRYTLDRWIARGSISLLAIATALVLSVPFMLSVIGGLCDSSLWLNKWPDESAFLNDYYNPFVNPGDFESRPVSQAIISILGIVLLSGLIVSLLVNYLKQRSIRWKKGELHYSFGTRFGHCLYHLFSLNNNYCVVIGGHETANGLISQLVNKYNRIIVFSDCDIEQYRSDVESILKNEEQCNKIVFYQGKRNSEADLHHLDVHCSRLKEIFILGENTEKGEPEEAHDALNMRCVSILSKLIDNKKRKEKLDCYVFFENQSTSLLFQKNDIDETIKKNLNFIAYNFYELWAQKVLSGFKGLHYPHKFPFNNLKNEEILDANLDKHLHIIIIGMTKSGIALALEAARSCHYPNFAASQMQAEFGSSGLRIDGLKKMENRRTRITFIDTNAKRQEMAFRARHPHIFEFCLWKSSSNKTWCKPPKQDEKSQVYTDVEFEFIHANIESIEARDYVQSAINDPTALVTIASCLSTTPKALSAMMYLPITDKKKQEINMLVYQPIDSSLVDILPKGILHFGKTSETIDLDFIHEVESRARRINYVWSNKEFNYTEQSNTTSKSNTEESIIKLWQEQVESKRWSSRYQACALMQRSNWINYNKAEESSISEDAKKWFDGIMERTEHNRWIMSQLIFSLESKEVDTEGSLEPFVFDTRLSYRQLYIESCDKKNEKKSKMYRSLLGENEDGQIQETNDRRMIRNTDWIQQIP